MPDLYMVFPGGRRKALTLSYDDGVEQDIRLIELMNKHGLKGTFNINSGLFAPEGKVYPAGHIHRRMSKSQAVRLYAQSGQEVALHCYEHGDLTMQLPGASIRQVIRDKEELESLFGHIIRGMAYPYGPVSDAVAQALPACGVAYSRTTVSTQGFDLPTDWLRLAATCHHNNPELMNLARKLAEETPVYRPWLFYLWGHSYEFEARDNWNVIEEFAAYIGGREDIWYATNIEVHDYVEAWRHMQSSADGNRVLNLSALTLYIRRGDQIFTAAPGQETVLA